MEPTNYRIDPTQQARPSPGSYLSAQQRYPEYYTYMNITPPPPPPPRKWHQGWIIAVVLLMVVFVGVTATLVHLAGNSQTHLSSAIPTPTLDAQAGLQSSDFSKFIEAFAIAMANKDYTAIQKASDTENFQEIPLDADGSGNWNDEYSKLITGNASYIIHYPPITADQEGYSCVGYSKTGITLLNIKINAADVQYVVGTATGTSVSDTNTDSTVFAFELPNAQGATWLWRSVTYNNSIACHLQ